MARLDVRAVQSRGRFRHALELQNSDFSNLPTVLIAPLIDPDELAMYPGINPVLEVDGQPMALRIEQMVAAPASKLGKVIGNLLNDEYEITRALERLMFRS